MSYFDRQELTLDNYKIVIYPHISIPPDMEHLDMGDAIQFGADFTVSFSREGEHQKKLMMLQFVFPQLGTEGAGIHQSGIWNMDRNIDHVSCIEDCAYGISSFNMRIGPDMQEVCKSKCGTTLCCISDIHREIYDLNNKETSCSDNTHKPVSLKTVFANFVVESSHIKPKLLLRGIIWSYEFRQRSASGEGCNEFDAIVTGPSYVRDFSPFAAVLASKGLKNEEDYTYCS